MQGLAGKVSAAAPLQLRHGTAWVAWGRAPSAGGWDGLPGLGHARGQPWGWGLSTGKMLTPPLSLPALHRRLGAMLLLREGRIRMPDLPSHAGHTGDTGAAAPGRGESRAPTCVGPRSPAAAVGSSHEEVGILSASPVA